MDPILDPRIWGLRGRILGGISSSPTPKSWIMGRDRGFAHVNRHTQHTQQHQQPLYVHTYTRTQCVYQRHTPYSMLLHQHQISCNIYWICHHIVTSGTPRNHRISWNPWNMAQFGIKGYIWGVDGQYRDPSKPRPCNGLGR